MSLKSIETFVLILKIFQNDKNLIKIILYIYSLLCNIFIFI
jgi:hypothetical protein